MLTIIYMIVCALHPSVDINPMILYGLVVYDIWMSIIYNRWNIFKK